MKYLTDFRKTVETGVDPRLLYETILWYLCQISRTLLISYYYPQKKFSHVGISKKLKIRIPLL